MNPDGRTKEQSPSLPKSDFEDPFPHIKDLAVLANHVYGVEKFKEAYTVVESNEWSCVETFLYNDGYRGAAYRNVHKTHLVIAHGGTEPKFIRKPIEFLRDTATNIWGVVLGNDVSQISSAILFTQKMATRYHGDVSSISLTGHSLGGWLAQLCAFYLEFPAYWASYNSEKNSEKRRRLDVKRKKLKMNLSVPIDGYRCHVVSFESPGCRELLKGVIDPKVKAKWEEKVEGMDITVIITNSNWINSWSEHVGYLVSLEVPGSKQVSKISSHSMALIVEVLKGAAEPKLKEVYGNFRGRATVFGPPIIKLQGWYIGPSNSCQMRIFGRKALDFISHAQVLSRWTKDTCRTPDELRSFETGRVHAGTRHILHMLKDLLPQLEIQNGNINYSCLEGRERGLSNICGLITSLRIWFQENSQNWSEVWFENFVESIKCLPSCRRTLLQEASCKYLEQIPRLFSCAGNPLHLPSKVECMMCKKISDFLSPEYSNRLLLVECPSKSCLRLMMTQAVNCLLEQQPENVLIYNMATLSEYDKVIPWDKIFSLHPVSTPNGIPLIVVECESLAENSDVIRDMLKDLLSSSPLQRMILVSLKDERKILQASPELTDVFDGSRLTETIHLNNLKPESMKKVLTCQFSIERELFTLDNSESGLPFLLNGDQDPTTWLDEINSPQLICEIFQGKVINLVDEKLPPMPFHYMRRRLYPHVFEAQKARKFSDVIVVKDPKNSVCFIATSNSVEREFEKFVRDSASTEFNRTLPEHSGYHVFKFQSPAKGVSELTWQGSVGLPCPNYLKHVEGSEMEEEGILNLENKFVILADEPGMGKSGAITNAFLNYKNSLKEVSSQHSDAFRWCSYINLKLHQLELRKPRDWNWENAHELFFEFLATAMRVETPMGRCLLKLCLKKQQSLSLFVDSFDEVSEEGQHFILGLLEYLKALNSEGAGRSSSGGIRVWIATRVYAKRHLESALRTKAYKFYKITNNEQLCYLTEYFTSLVSAQSDETTKGLAENYSIRILDDIRRVLGSEDSFIGVPLQLFLLATIHADGFKRLIAAEEQDPKFESFLHKFESTMELYEIFIAKKLEIWLDEKCGLERRSNWVDENLKNDMNRIHSQAAFLYLASSYEKNTGKDFNPRVGWNDCWELNQAGLCQAIVDWKIKFRLPRKVFAQVRKTKVKQPEDALQVLRITLTSTVWSNPNNREQLRRILEDSLIAKVVLSRDDAELENIRDGDPYSQVHFFLESSMTLDYQKSFHLLPEADESVVELPFAFHNFQFIHQTLAEYFSAKYLIGQLDTSREHVLAFLNVHYGKPYFGKLRFFLDSMLSKDIPSLRNLEFLTNKSKLDSFQALFFDSDWKRQDALGRNLFHYACAYGDHEEGIFWMIPRNPTKFWQVDNLGRLPLSYSFLSKYKTVELFAQLPYYVLVYENEDFKLLNIHEGGCEAGLNIRNLLQFLRLTCFYNLFLGKKYASVVYNIFHCFDTFKIAGDEKRKRLISRLNMHFESLKDLFNFKLLKSFSFRKPPVSDSQNVDVSTDWLFNNVHESFAFKFLELWLIHNSNIVHARPSLAPELRFYENFFNREEGYQWAARIIKGGIFGQELVSLVSGNLGLYYDEKLFQHLDEIGEELIWDHVGKTKGDYGRQEMVRIMAKHDFVSFFRAAKSQTHYYYFSYLKELITLALEVCEEEANASLKVLFNIGVLGEKGGLCFLIWSSVKGPIQESLLVENFNSTFPISEIVAVGTFENIFKDKNTELKRKSSERLSWDFSGSEDIYLLKIRQKKEGFNFNTATEYAEH